MTSQTLVKGANVVLDRMANNGSLAAVILGLSWDSGSLECDACALVCGPDRRVIDDQHFLFWNNVVLPDRAVLLRLQADPQDPLNDRAQLLVNLTDLSSAVETIVLSLSTLVDSGRLSSLTRLRLRAVDASSGAELASYTAQRDLTTETCAVIAELYRHRGTWKLRAVGQGYDDGLIGLGRDYGVELSK